MFSEDLQPGFVELTGERSKADGGFLLDGEV